MEPILGQIQAFGFNFAPRGWAKCDGQLLPISQYSALFSLLGTTYGGDGRTTFALPDLRSRSPMHSGTGPGLSTRSEGERSGAESVTLTLAEIPSHSHFPKASDQPGNSDYPIGTVCADETHTQFKLYSTAPTGYMTETSNSGGGLSHNNMHPYLVINYCIALQGIFPSRNAKEEEKKTEDSD